MTAVRKSKGANFKYTNASLGEDWSQEEAEEEDLDATLKAIKTRIDANVPPVAIGDERQQETEDEFFRNFLLDEGMTQTLECFQNEWSERVQKGLVDPACVVMVPGVYTDNRRLETELKHAQSAREECSRAASSAAQLLDRIQRSRDLKWLQHQRLLQEKNKLVEEVKRLQAQSDSCESAYNDMTEKYQAVVKRTDGVTSQRGKKTL